MCLYPVLIKNPRYLRNKKNGGKIPEHLDPREAWVPVGCGECYECRKQKANEWRVRLMEEIKEKPKALFLTLTFSDESLRKLHKKTKSEDVNDVAREAVKLFRERWRKQYKKSIRHWLITELGEENGRIHMHGIIFDEQAHEHPEEVEKHWKYGYVGIGKYCNIKTINYIIKYVTKKDYIHKDYKQIILCSPGLGNAWTDKTGWNRWDGEKTKETYKAKNGVEYGLPIYYRNKIWTEEQRTKLWMQRLDKGMRYVRGIPIDINREGGMEEFYNVLHTAQKWNERMKYGKREWKKEKYREMVKNQR